MFQVKNYTDNKENNYQLLLQQLSALLDGEKNCMASLANASALLNQCLEEVNWVGFYIWQHDENELVLGPFQGLPACVRIPYGKGVCGTAIKDVKTQRVADVSLFPGHIACDVASQSEIVIPIIIKDVVYGVLDIDSPIKNRFDEVDQQYLEQFVSILSVHLS